MALFLVFLVLKLCDVIAWSWWWITAPLWAAPAIALATLLVAVISLAVAEALSKRMAASKAKAKPAAPVAPTKKKRR